MDQVLEDITNTIKGLNKLMEGSNGDTRTDQGVAQAIMNRALSSVDSGALRQALVSLSKQLSE